MRQRMIEKRLRETGKRLRHLREELRIVDEQLAHLSDDAGDKGIRALVSETPLAGSEYREARRHQETMLRHRSGVIDAIAEIEHKQDQLLDQMSK